MNIVIDIFIKAPFLVEKVKLMPDIQKIFNDIVLVVQGRLTPLEAEINQEEKADGATTKWTMIYLDPPKDDHRKFISVEGYSEPLTQKMLNCFNETDARIIGDMVRNIMSRGYN